MMDTLSTLVLEDPYYQSRVLLCAALSYNHFTTTIYQSKKEAKVERPLLALKGTNWIVDSIPS